MSSRSTRWDGAPISLTPIGVVRSPHHERVEAPRQPRAAEGIEGTVELFAGRGLEDALTDLSQWEYLWLVVWFDRNPGFRPKVLPPRSERKRGVLATRAPYRPNPIGISAVRLLRVEGLCLYVRGLDLLDATPVLDVKPYVPYTDAIPEANHGWMDGEGQGARPADASSHDVSRPDDPIGSYEVLYSPLAAAQLEYLRDSHQIVLGPRIEAALALGPSPHAYRRIRKDADGYRLAVKDWRVRFSSAERRITVEELGSGYRPRELFGDQGQAPAAHRAFVARFAPKI